MNSNYGEAFMFEIFITRAFNDIKKEAGYGLVHKMENLMNSEQGQKLSFLDSQGSMQQELTALLHKAIDHCKKRLPGQVNDLEKVSNSLPVRSNSKQILQAVDQLLDITESLK